MANLDKIKIGKQITGGIVGAGVTQIVNGFVDAVITPQTVVQRVLIFAGKTGISMLAADLVKQHVDEKIDEAVEWVNTSFSKDA